MKKRNYTILLCMLICILLSVQVDAQQSNEPGGGSDLFASNTDRPAEEEDPNVGSPPDPQDTPIDGGLVLLLMAGTVYGIKKYKGLQKPAATGEMPALAV